MFNLVVPPDSPCGCESGRAFAECCLRDGRVDIHPVSTDAPGPTTDTTVKRCYLAGSNNCGGQISGEHIIASAVLRNISDSKVRIVGPGFQRDHGISSDSLKTKCLCQRHNEALGTLDAQAGRFFRAITTFAIAIADRNPEPTFRLFAGFDLERWLAKTALALFRSGVCGIGEDTHKISAGCLGTLEAVLQPPLGLYVPIRAVGGGRLEASIGRQTSFRLLAKSGIVGGVSITLAGIELVLAFDTEYGAADLTPDTHVYRPQYLNMFTGNDVRCIALAWPPGWSGGIVWYSEGAVQPLPSNRAV